MEILISPPEVCVFHQMVAPSSSSPLLAGEIGVAIRTDRIQRHETDVYHQHADFMAVYLVRRGRGLHVIDDQPFAVARGDVYVMACGATHAYSRFEDLELEALYFQPSALEPSHWLMLQRESAFITEWVAGRSGRWLHLGPDESHAVLANLDGLRAEWIRNSPASGLAVHALLFRHLLALARLGGSEAMTGPRTTATGASELIANAVRFIDRQFAEPIRIEEIAARFGYSPDRFTHVFALKMGRPPRDYLRHVRIERAKTLLKGSSLPVAEIGFQTGYQEPAYFARVFRQSTGVTPLHYRRGFN